MRTVTVGANLTGQRLDRPEDAAPPGSLVGGSDLFSLVAIGLCGRVIAGGVAYALARYAGGWTPGERFASALPPLVVLVAETGAGLAGWLVAVALAHR